MKTYHKIIEYAYLFIAVFLIEETIRTWGDNNKTFLYIALALMAIAMFLFRRWFRSKTKNKNP